VAKLTNVCKLCLFSAGCLHVMLDHQTSDEYECVLNAPTLGDSEDSRSAKTAVPVVANGSAPSECER
jgi:hypothetical protein